MFPWLRATTPTSIQSYSSGSNDRHLHNEHLMGSCSSHQPALSQKDVSRTSYGKQGLMPIPTKEQSLGLTSSSHHRGHDFQMQQHHYNTCRMQSQYLNSFPFAYFQQASANQDSQHSYCSCTKAHNNVYTASHGLMPTPSQSQQSLLENVTSFESSFAYISKGTQMKTMKKTYCKDVTSTEIKVNSIQKNESKPPDILGVSASEDSSSSQSESDSENEDYDESSFTPGIQEVAYSTSSKGKKIWSYDPKEIQEWRNARRKNYPTDANIKKKQLKEQERTQIGNIVNTTNYSYRGKGNVIGRTTSLKPTLPGQDTEALLVSICKDVGINLPQGDAPIELPSSAILQAADSLPLKTPPPSQPILSDDSPLKRSKSLYQTTQNKPSLLRMLLNTEIRRETNILLQCVRHAINHNFYQ